MIADDAPIPPARPVRTLHPQPKRAAAVEAQFKNKGGVPPKLERSAVWINGEKFYPGSEVRLAKRIHLGLDDDE